MSTQYNQIQAPYDEIRKTFIAHLERANIHETVQPFIKDASVLELACGSGFYLAHFLEWGASKVVGVDISSAMLAQARQTASTHHPPQASDSLITLKLADCSIPSSYEGGPFDLVFGAWFLNYASSGAEMVDMFRNIALNLKPGGRFVAVTPPPAHDPTASIRAEMDARPGGSEGLSIQITGVVEDGVSMHLHADTPCGAVDFDCYHLRKDVHEAAARAGGLGGELVWSVTKVDDDLLRGWKSGGDLGELESYKVVPHYGILVVTK
jgi:SAM-dependent methyltransferase